LSKRLGAVLLLFWIALVLAMPLTLLASEQVEDYFSFRISVDGEDLSSLDAIPLDPDESHDIVLHVFDVNREVTLESISIAITFSGLPVATIDKTLGRTLQPGEEYTEPIAISANEFLTIGGLNIVTGLYHGTIELNYSIGGSPLAYSQPKDLRILGNPAASAVGIAAIVATGSAVAAGTVLGTSLAASGAGAAAANVTLIPLPALNSFILGRLEPTARGSVVGAIVRAARKRIVKRNCPICSTRIKHDYCYTCRKTAKEVEKEYTEKVKELALQGMQLLASGEVKTLDALRSRLNINDRLGMDVIATLKDARMVKIKGLAGKLMAKAVTTGISSAISIILWITIGGFAVLSVWLLITVLLLALLLPILITKFFQWRARRKLAAG